MSGDGVGGVSERPVHPNARLLKAFHQAQAAFYAGGDDAANLRGLLADDIAGHVPGRSPIAGHYHGHDEVLGYFAARRAHAKATFRVQPRAILAAGQPGTVFLSLDAARLGAVAVARASAWRLPYHRAAMRVRRDGDLVTYVSRRRWPGSRGASSRVVLRIGAPYRPEELTMLDRFLTARWYFYSRSRRGLARTAAHHPPWRLARGAALQVDERLIAATGLREPDGEALVHWADRTDALVGRPRLDRPTATARQRGGDRGKVVLQVST